MGPLTEIEMEQRSGSGHEMMAWVGPGSSPHLQHGVVLVMLAIDDHVEVGGTINMVKSQGGASNLGHGGNETSN